MRKIISKAESMLSVLVIMSVFIIMLISYSKWQQKQIKEQNQIYQLKQAMLIAENQIALKAVDLPCESYLKQNNLEFRVSCNQDVITIYYPLGKFELKK